MKLEVMTQRPIKLTIDFDIFMRKLPVELGHLRSIIGVDKNTTVMDKNQNA